MESLSNLICPTGLVLAATRTATIPARGLEGSPEKANHSLAGPAPGPTNQNLVHAPRNLVHAPRSPGRAPRSHAPDRSSASPAQRAAQRQSLSAIPAVDPRRQVAKTSPAVAQPPQYRTGREKLSPNLPLAPRLPSQMIGGPSRGRSALPLAPLHVRGLAHDLDRPLGISAGCLWGRGISISVLYIFSCMLL